jgi:predicted nucleotidyltransferase
MKLKEALREIYGERAPVAIVYGSQARRAANSASDIDVLLIYPEDIQPGREIQRLSDVLASINLEYQELISVLPVSEKEYRRRATPLWVNIQQEGVPIDAI